MKRNVEIATLYGMSKKGGIVKMSNLQAALADFQSY